MKSEIEIPKNECKGCEARDRIIRSVSEEADRLQRQLEDLLGLPHIGRAGKEQNSEKSKVA